MAVTKELSVMIENKRGALAELCSVLAKVAMNIQALMAREQAGVAHVRLVVDNLDVARKVLAGLGLKYAEQDVIPVRVSDKPGALGKLTRKLSDHRVDIKYCYGSILKGSGEAIIILAVSDMAPGAKVGK